MVFIQNSSCNRSVPYYSLTGYSFGTPQADQYAPQVPPPPTTPGSAPLGFAPATTPTQDLSKAPTGQPDFPYSQYGKRHSAVCGCFLSPFDIFFWVYCWLRPAPLTFSGCNTHLLRRICTYHLACTAVHAYMLVAYVKPCDTAMNVELDFPFWLTQLGSGLSVLVQCVWIRSSCLVTSFNLHLSLEGVCSSLCCPRRWTWFPPPPPPLCWRLLLFSFCHFCKSLSRAAKTVPNWAVPTCESSCWNVSGVHVRCLVGLQWHECLCVF